MPEPTTIATTLTRMGKRTPCFAAFTTNISGLTFIVAMSGMFLSGMLLFDGFAVAAILVVLEATVLTNLTTEWGLR